MSNPCSCPDYPHFHSDGCPYLAALAEAAKPFACKTCGDVGCRVMYVTCPKLTPSDKERADKAEARVEELEACLAIALRYWIRDSRNRVFGATEHASTATD